MSILMMLAFASQAQAVVGACDQKHYDKIYYSIVQEALSDKIHTDIFVSRKRNDTIEALRALCRGQMSSYELGKRVTR